MAIEWHYDKLVDPQQELSEANHLWTAQALSVKSDKRTALIKQHIENAIESLSEILEELEEG